MNKLKLKIKYFGQVEEWTGKKEEKIAMDESITLEKLKVYCFEKYDIPKNAIIKLAINQSFEESIQIKDGDEIAFLPPFAGG